MIRIGRRGRRRRRWRMGEMVVVVGMPVGMEEEGEKVEANNW